MASFSGVFFSSIIFKLEMAFFFFLFWRSFDTFAHANAFGYFWAGVPFILLLLN